VRTVVAANRSCCQLARSTLPSTAKRPRGAGIEARSRDEAEACGQPPDDRVERFSRRFREPSSEKDVNRDEARVEQNEAHGL